MVEPPMKGFALATAVLLLAFLPAGCLDPDGAGRQAPEATGSAAQLPHRLAATLAPAPARDAQAGLDWWAHFATTYTTRNAFTPANQEATDHIAASLEDLGLEVTVIDYPVCTPLLGTPCAPTSAGPAKIHVVVGLKRGLTDPGHAIALGAHYDNVYPGAGLTEGTLEAAYDNGSGTAMVYNLCKQLAQVPLEKSLLCLFFDGEELGRLGSSSFVADPPAGTPDVAFYLGYDMVGLNWPGHEWKLYNWVGGDHAEDLHPFVNATVHEVLGWPDAGVEVFPFNDRNSDEASFIAADIPTIRFAGGRTAGTYPQYHKLDDTVAFVDAFAGGRDNFAKGFGAIVEESVLLVRLLDQTSLAAMQPPPEAAAPEQT